MRACISVAALVAVTACAPIVRQHGYVPTMGDRDALVVGADTKLTVEDTVGRPSDTGLRDGDSWYYVENTISTFLFFEPEVTDRTVLALDFDADGILQNISEFGLEEGRVVELTTRVTPTDRRRRNVLSNIFGNIGGFGNVPLPGG